MKFERYLFCRTCLFAILLVLLVSIKANAQSNVGRHLIKEIRGTIVDENSDPVIGATVSIKNTTTGAFSNADGAFSLNVRDTDTIVVTYIGYETQDVLVGGQTNFNIKLVVSSQTIDEVVVTAWGKEKKTTMVGSVSTLKPKELKGPTSNLTSMLSGRVAGLISYQTSGEPGRDNATFFIRGVGSFGTGKVDPLILINGIESTTNELARIQPDDIEGFSILKDATATSMYGSRGANGVMLISTKNGFEGKTKFNVRYETSLSGNAKGYNIADNITYMNLANEASMTRGGERLYDFKKIEKTKAGANEYLYPNNNWKDIMIKDNTVNHRVNMNASGGGDIGQYYLSASYRFDNGMLRSHKANDFETNVQSSSIEIRSNIDLKLTKTTNASVRVSGLFDDLSGPATNSGVYTGGDVFKSMLKANPVMFPAVFPQSMRSWVKHPLFGNAPMSQKAGSGTSYDLYYNPYASALSGYSEDNKANFTVQFELNQDFEFILPGLKARMMAYTKRNTRSIMTRSVSPFYYMGIEDPLNKDEVKDISPLNENDGREYLGYNERGKEVWSENWLEGSLAYERTFNHVHNGGASLVSYVREKKLSNAGSLERSLPQRNVSLSGRLTYGFDNRYLAEFNFGYNASERFDAKHRWGFFPSTGIAWNVKNESFMKQLTFLDKLKVRYSYGVVGNDELTDWFNRGEERFFYLDMVNMTNVGGIKFGTDYGNSYDLIAVSRYGNPNITWEKSYKSNLAWEIGLFKSLNIEVDMFWDKRKSILMTRGDIPVTMGLRSTVRANVGELKSQGFEVALDYNKTITKDLWASVRGTFTYAKNKTVVYEEPNYPNEIRYRSRIGNPWHTIYGYVAERLFMDDEDVANSPKQFGDYSAGDIKYHDVNSDGVIDNNDLVPMGYPSEPEINYGFGFSLGYKDFDLSAFFSGIANVSFMISPASITPFVKSGGQINGLLDAIAKDHWSEENRNSYAFFPRLSTTQIENNNQSSTWWLRNGSFLKLSTLELGYQPKGKWVRQKTGMDSFRLYLSGSNLFKISKFKTWDAEMKGNGMGYPLQRVINLGVQVSF